MLPHGNADVERRFSLNNDILTSDRAEMTPETLNGLLFTKDALKFYDKEIMLPSNLPLT